MSTLAVTAPVPRAVLREQADDAGLLRPRAAGPVDAPAATAALQL